MAETLETINAPTASGSRGGDGKAVAGSSTSILGARIDRYMVLSVLGAGAMGVVYAAYDPELDRKLALKLHKRRGGSHGHARLQREAQALAKLDHRNVVSVHDVGVHDGQLFVAMELVAGQTLREWMLRDPAPTWKKLLATFVAAGEGLAAAHGAGLIHRDFKPENVMIGDDGRVRIMDFGLARAAGEDDVHALTVPGLSDVDEPRGGSAEDGAPLLQEHLTRTGALLGTPAYMAPEQLTAGTADARADQFAFCVALYEALYGLRPFPTRASERLEAIVQGRLAVPPAKSEVPSRLQRILARGLARDPDARWPSMRALLAALADDPSLRWRRRLVTVLGLAVVGGGALGLGLSLDRGEEACSGMEAHLSGVWDATTRAEVEAALVGTGLSYADDTWERVEAGLDAYTGRWIEARSEACEATRSGEQSEQLLDLRVACLDRGLEQVKATVATLVAADAATLEHAIEAVAGLPQIDRCADVEALTAEFPPPEDPALAARIVALSERLTEGDALNRVAKYEESLELARAVVAEAEPLGHPPLLTRALLLEAIDARTLGDYAAADTSLVRAYAEALRNRMFREAARAATEEMTVLGRYLSRPEDSEHWARHAELLSESLEREEVRAHFYHARGVTLGGGRGDYEAAFAYHERALQLYERIREPVDPMIANVLNNLGHAAQRLGRYEQARVFDERALAMDEELYGPEHPHVATSLHNLGNAAKAQGDEEAARRYHERALRIRERALGPAHPDVGGSHNSLGSLAKRRGDHELARAHYLKALAIFEAKLGPEHPFVAGVLSNLGSVARKLGDHEGALEHLERSLDISKRQLGDDHPDLGIPLYNLGELATARGEPAAALAYFQRALALFERAFGPEHPVVADTLMNVGEVELQLGEVEESLAAFERALAIRLASESTSEALAAARFRLAQALWDAPGGERRRALELATAALAGLASGEAEPLRAEIQAWRSTHAPARQP